MGIHAYGVDYTTLPVGTPMGWTTGLFISPTPSECLQHSGESVGIKRQRETPRAVLKLGTPALRSAVRWPQRVPHLPYSATYPVELWDGPVRIDKLYVFPDHNFPMIPYVNVIAVVDNIEEGPSWPHCPKSQLHFLSQRLWTSSALKALVPFLYILIMYIYMYYEHRY